MKQDYSVIVLAAGQGTRMKSRLPKVLHSLCGRTLLGHALATASNINPREILTVVRHERDLVADEAMVAAPEGIIVDQDDIPGTGRAVFCALQEAQQRGVELGRTVLVTSGDVPLLEPATLQDVLTAHFQADAQVTVVTTVVEDPSGYGRIVRAGTGSQIEKIVEHRDASAAQLQITEINAGIYAFDTKFLVQALEGLGRDNDQGEIYLTDVVEGADRALPYVLEDTWQAEGCNDLVQLATLRSVLNRRLCETHMRNGVAIVDPTTTSIDVQAVLEADCCVEPNTQVLGHSIIRCGAVVGPGSTLEDAVIGEGAEVPHSVVQEASVADMEVLAPFSVRL